MTSNLVPTPRTDRNGKTVIRHMRPEQQSATSKQIPGVTLTSSPVDIRKIKRDVYWVLQSNYKHGVADSSDIKNVRNWVDNSSEAQLAEIAVALEVVNSSEDSSDPAMLREARVVRSILSSTLSYNGPTGHAHGLMAARSAFCSEWSTSHEADMRTALPVYLGLNCDGHGNKLPAERLLKPKEMTAALRYSYELITARTFPIRNTPFNEVMVSKPSSGFRETANFSMVQYGDPKLLTLVAENADRVTDLIDLSQNHETFDPERLAVLMGYEGPKALGTGSL